MATLHERPEVKKDQESEARDDLAAADRLDRLVRLIDEMRIMSGRSEKSDQSCDDIEKPQQTKRRAPR